MLLTKVKLATPIAPLSNLIVVAKVSSQTCTLWVDVANAATELNLPKIGTKWAIS